MTDATIASLTNLALKFRDDRDWKQFHNAKDMALSLALESAELLELTQWRSGAELESHLRANPGPLADELADVLYWVLEIAHEYGIDLPAAFEAKLAKNAAKYPVEQSRGSSKKYTELK